MTKALRRFRKPMRSKPSFWSSTGIVGPENVRMHARHEVNSMNLRTLRLPEPSRDLLSNSYFETYSRHNPQHTQQISYLPQNPCIAKSLGCLGEMGASCQLRVCLDGHLSHRTQTRILLGFQRSRILSSALVVDGWFVVTISQLLPNRRQNSGFAATRCTPVHSLRMPREFEQDIPDLDVRRI